MLPDLSGLTAVTRLRFAFEASEATGRSASHLQQVDILSLVSPLVTLECLELRGVPWMCIQAVVPLQYILPPLRYVSVWSIEDIMWYQCWAARRGPPAGHDPLTQEREEQVLEKVERLLLPKVQLDVGGGTLSLLWV
jgi:hypothetical protein